MPIGAANYRQKATYWGVPIQGGFGNLSFATPVVILCRWEDVSETYLDKTGLEQISNAVVWAYSRLEDGGYITKGEHLDVSDPTTLSSAYTIKRSDEIPDLRGLNYERRIFL